MLEMKSLGHEFAKDGIGVQKALRGFSGKGRNTTVDASETGNCYWFLQGAAGR